MMGIMTICHRIPFGGSSLRAEFWYCPKPFVMELQRISLDSYSANLNLLQYKAFYVYESSLFLKIIVTNCNKKYDIMTHSQPFRLNKCVFLLQFFKKLDTYGYYIIEVIIY